MVTTDAKSIWQSQPTEPFGRSRHEVLENARKFDAGVRRKKYVYFVVFLILPLMNSSRAGFEARFWWQMIRCGLLALWLFESEGGVFYAQLRNRTQLVGLGLNTALTPGLEFYRRELLYGLDYYRNNGLRTIYPIVFIGIVALPVVFIAIRNPSTIPNLIPFVTLVVVWIAWADKKKKQEVPRIQGEIDALDAYHREIQS